MIDEYLDGASMERLLHLSTAGDNELYSELVASPVAETYEGAVDREGLEEANRLIRRKVDAKLEDMRDDDHLKAFSGEMPATGSVW